MTGESLKLGYAVAGKYVVERELGRGGMGVVYLVVHATTGKRMAMKCLLPHLIHDAELVGRFMREAKVMGRLNHRHIVDVVDVGRDGDVLFIVMELLEGKPLSELLRDASMTLEEALVILLRAMEGVAAAHEHGVIHRDLKPDNIFVCIGASGRLDDPRVLDFGISRLDESSGPQLTRTGVAMGTGYYMAYEQLSGLRDLDHRVDVYAMGVILYEAVSGAPPYVGESLSAIAVRMLTSEPQDLASLRPDLPAGLGAVIMKAIARQRDKRYEDMRKLMADIRPFVSQSVWMPMPSRDALPLRTPRDNGAAPTSRQPAALRSQAQTRTSNSQIRTRARASNAPLASAGPAKPRAWATRASLGGGVALLTASAAIWYANTETRLESPITESPPSVPRVPTRAHDAPVQVDGVQARSSARAQVVEARGSAGAQRDDEATPTLAAAEHPAAAAHVPDSGVASVHPAGGLPRPTAAPWWKQKKRAPLRPLSAAAAPRMLARPPIPGAPDASPGGVSSAAAAPKLTTSPSNRTEHASPVAREAAPTQSGTTPPSEPRATEGRAGKLGASEF